MEHGTSEGKRIGQQRYVGKGIRKAAEVIQCFLAQAPFIIGGMSDEAKSVKPF